MRQLIDTLRIVIGLTIIFALIFAFWWIKPAKMGKSDETMQPGIMKDARAYFSRSVRAVDDLKLGDIVLYHKLDPEAGQKQQNISRVVAMPGQRVSITSGSVLIDGEPPAERANQSGQLPVDVPEFTVPRQHVFVLYDKRVADKRKLFERLVHVSRIKG